MPGPSSNSSPAYDQDPLVRILAAMVESGLKWESEHATEDPERQYQLTEESTDIHLISTDLCSTDAVPESPPKGDKHVPA